MQIIYYFVAYVLARYALNREIQLAIIITSSLSIRNPFRLVRTYRLDFIRRRIVTRSDS